MPKQPRTLVQYTRELFQDSLITGVPQIILTRHVARKIIKSVVLASCLVGFVYQTTEFLHIFWNYPTVLDIKVEYPDVIESPAITFCNLNGIKRREFCKQYPQDCVAPIDREEFCTAYPDVCKEDSTLQFPNMDSLEFEKEPSDKYLQELGHLRDETLKFCSEITQQIGHSKCRLNDSIRTLMPDGSEGYRTCHTIFSNVKSKTLNQYSLRVLKVSQMLYHIVFEMQPEEYFRPDREVGVIVAVHSPNILVNPFSEGFVIKPGNFYSVHLKIVEEKLLPSPYETRCQDYKAMWFARGGKGPLTQEMCVAECIYNASIADCNCVGSDLIYPHEDRICGYDELQECFNYNVSECYANCQQPCEFTDFEYNSQERKLEATITNPIEDIGDGDKLLKHKAVMALFLKRPEKIIYSHRPQYEDIEVFSFIGGYVGMWLGISLVGVFDFFESVFLVIYFWMRKTFLL